MPHTPNDHDDAAHMVTVAFHPDDTFTVNGGDQDEDDKVPTSES
eukprot:SAG11_NODE_26978_length_338_cov_1.527197_1_plen_43_part_01